MTKLLLIFGPSGVGKSAIISELKKIDTRFIYISPYMTRPLRKGEEDKISVSKNKLYKMKRNGEFLVVNELFGVLYGTPKLPIQKAFQKNSFPLVDWPIDRKEIMDKVFPGRIFSIYLEPPNLDCLYYRLSGRNNVQTRYEEAKNEIELLNQGKYDSLIDFRVVNNDNMQKEIAKKVYEKYLGSINILND